MSVEKQASKALRRMVFWRIVGEIISTPRIITNTIAQLCEQIGRWTVRLEMAIFSLELDSARRYKLLTGVDMGVAMGQPGRYGLVNHPDLADDAQRAFLGANDIVGEDE